MYISYIKRIASSEMRLERGQNSQNYLVDFVYRACVDYRQVIVIPSRLFGETRAETLVFPLIFLPPRRSIIDVFS